MKNVVNWFEIYTADFARARQFYTTVFRKTITDLPVDNERHGEMQYAIFENSEEASGTTGALVKLDVAQPGIGGTLIYFHCEDVNNELSRVEAAGGKIIRSKQSVGDLGFIALIQDTEGNMIGLRSLK
jgi:predicted enzyme related to lactoylglutathione lyase